MISVYADMFEIVQTLVVLLIGGPINVVLAARSWHSRQVVKESMKRGLADDIDEAIADRRFFMGSWAVLGQIILFAAAVVGLMSPPPEFSSGDNGYLQTASRSVAMTLVSVILAIKATTDYYYTAKIERVWDPKKHLWKTRTKERS